jgi:hypothetical protein
MFKINNLIIHVLINKFDIIHKALTTFQLNMKESQTKLLLN